MTGFASVSFSVIAFKISEDVWYTWKPEKVFFKLLLIILFILISLSKQNRTGGLHGRRRYGAWIIDGLVSIKGSSNKPLWARIYISNVIIFLVKLLYTFSTELKGLLWRSPCLLSTDQRPCNTGWTYKVRMDYFKLGLSGSSLDLLTL